MAMMEIDDSMIWDAFMGVNAKAKLLYEVAKELCDQFHQERGAYISEMKGSRGVCRSPHLICRVTKNPTGVGITIAWYQNEYFGLRGNKKTISRYIKRGKSFFYSPKKFLLIEL